MLAKVRTLENYLGKVSELLARGRTTDLRARGNPQLFTHEELINQTLDGIAKADAEIQQLMKPIYSTLNEIKKESETLESFDKKVEEQKGLITLVQNILKRLEKV